MLWKEKMNKLSGRLRNSLKKFFSVFSVFASHLSPSIGAPAFLFQAGLDETPLLQEKDERKGRKLKKGIQKQQGTKEFFQILGK